MPEREDAELIDNPNMLVVYVDEIGTVEVSASIARVTFCERCRLGGRQVLMPVLKLIGPVSSVFTGEVARMVAKEEQKAVLGELALQ